MLLAVRISSYGCTWEVWRALKKLSPRATLTLLSCSPNFPHASITRYTHAKHEPILKYTHAIKCNLMDLTSVHKLPQPSLLGMCAHAYVPQLNVIVRAR